MSQQITLSMKDAARKIMENEVSWKTITMRHRGRDYYLQSFPGSQLAFFIRPSNTSRRNSNNLPPLRVSILTLQNHNPNDWIFVDIVSAWESYYRRLGYTDFHYIPPVERDEWYLTSQSVVDLENFTEVHKSCLWQYKYRLTALGPRYNLGLEAMFKYWMYC